MNYTRASCVASCTPGTHTLSLSHGILVYIHTCTIQHTGTGVCSNTQRVHYFLHNQLPRSGKMVAACAMPGFMYTHSLTHKHTPKFVHVGILCGCFFSRVRIGTSILCGRKRTRCTVHSRNIFHSLNAERRVCHMMVMLVMMMMIIHLPLP